VAFREQWPLLALTAVVLAGSVLTVVLLVVVGR
jgi:hypothetical protein